MMVTFIITVFLLGVSMSILLAIVSHQSHKQTLATIDANTGYENRFVSGDGSSSIAIDTKKRVVWLSGQAQSSLVPYHELISSEVVENGISLTKTNRGSLIGRTIIGGALTGGVGAIVGGVTASRTQFQLGTIELRILTSIPSMPFVAVEFLQVKADKQNFSYKHALKEALQWHGRIAAAIKQIENEHQQIETGNKPAISEEFHIVQHADFAQKNLQNLMFAMAICLEKQRSMPKVAFWIDVGIGEKIIQLCSTSMADMFKELQRKVSGPGFILQLSFPDVEDYERFVNHQDKLMFTELGVEGVPCFWRLMEDQTTNTASLALKILHEVYALPTNFAYLVEPQRGS